MNIRTGRLVKRVRFGDLEYGDVFKAGTGAYYMKVSLYGTGEDKLNAVKLSNGALEQFMSSQMVEPVEHELIIKC